MARPHHLTPLALLWVACLLCLVVVGPSSCLGSSSSSGSIRLDSWLDSATCGAAGSAQATSSASADLESFVVAGECFAVEATSIRYTCQSNHTGAAGASVVQYVVLEQFEFDLTCTNLTYTHAYTADECHTVPDTEPPRSFRYSCAAEGRADLPALVVVLLTIGAMALHRMV